jgi:hypothetical protein
MGQVIQIDEARIRGHLGQMVRGTLEETLNAHWMPRQTSFAVPAVTSVIKPDKIPGQVVTSGRCAPAREK